jgi:hypothetical protein
MDISTKYTHLVDLVARMRVLQIEYAKFHGSDERKRMTELQRHVDAIVKDEIKERKSKQSDIF